MSPATRLTLAAALAACLAACAEPQPAAAPETPTAAAPEPAAAPITDEAGLRAAASKALAEQRFYAPAGSSAIDHYLALRALRPDDANLATALLELLYASGCRISEALELSRDRLNLRKVFDLEGLAIANTKPRLRLPQVS